jgi:hypothetical protein
MDIGLQYKIYVSLRYIIMLSMGIWRRWLQSVQSFGIQTARSQAEIHRRFGGPYRLHL